MLFNHTPIQGGRTDRVHLQGGQVFQQVPEFLQEMITQIITFLPRLVGAIGILIIGWIIGRVVAGIIRRVGETVGLDQWIEDTILSRFTGRR